MEPEITPPIQKNSSQIIQLIIDSAGSPAKEYFFRKSFSVGRSEECSVRLDEGGVSRLHIEVLRDKGSWWIIDKQSSNGTYQNGTRISMVELKDSIDLVLGNNGPKLRLNLVENKEEKPAAIKQYDPSVTQYIKHYFEENEGAAGEHTKMMRQAFSVVKKKQSSKYLRIIIGVGIIAVGVIIYAVVQQISAAKQMKLAENIFYDMKTLELEISAFRDKIADLQDPTISEAIQKFDERHKQLEKNYDALVNELGTYNLSEQEKLIVKTARIFGECEINMPEEFINEVKKYINRWKSSERMVMALERAAQNGYIPIIINYLVRHKLPPQFFYLPLQESDFKERVVGPPTRFGYAKGMWQFIAETGKRYGLAIGPLADSSIYDPMDERYNFPKATIAASKYIKDIYNTDAQASGLLVMASYNWGEQRIIQLIRTLPANPRYRNFWNLLKNYREKIPDETYNYVFYIFSAAVIGENPRLFGFNFDNPLKASLDAINY
jgi:membrane-bound lytic murein transglycosylase D